MKLRVKYTLITSALLSFVIGAAGVAIFRGERKFLEAQASERVETLGRGVTRIAQEALQSDDRFLLVSYLLWLQKAQPELVMATVTRSGHTATVGKEEPGLVYWQKTVSRKQPFRLTVSGAATEPASMSVSPNGVTMSVPGAVDVKVDEARAAADDISVKLGFSKSVLDAEVERAVRATAARTGAIAGFFIVLGAAGSLVLGQLLAAPIVALTAAVDAVAAGKFDVQVNASSRDEVGALAKRFNEMTGKLGELNQFREDIMHTLTHELNTPLSGLKGYLELWKEGLQPQDPAERDEALTVMMTAVQRMETSLGGALTLFKSGASLDGGPITLVRVDLILAQIYALFAPVAKSKRQKLTAPAEGRPESIYANEDLVRQIVTNLVSNAIKYTPAGGEVALDLRSDAKEIRFSVRDSGCGIAAEHLPHLFTKFFRAGQDRKPGQRIAGTGLGLNIAQKAAQSMGGRITVESVVGKGSTFSVFLPRARAQIKGGV